MALKSKIVVYYEATMSMSTAAGVQIKNHGQTILYFLH